ncbi:MAG: glycosyltransferase family 4 protein [Thermoplasmata archaeon]
MRLAQLSTRFPPGTGGVERHVQEISRRLVRAGNSVDVYTSALLTEFPIRRLDASVPRLEQTDAGTIHRLTVWSLPGELHYPFFLGLQRSLVRDRPELLHVHTFGTNQVAVARRHRRRIGTPFVLTAHFHPDWSIEGGWLRHQIREYYDRHMAGPILADASRIVVQTDAEEGLLRELRIPLPPVVKIPAGHTPLPPPPPGDRPFAHRLGIDGPFALFVGRLASNKGLPILFEAFRGLHRRDPTASLAIVGPDGGMRASLDRQAAELGISAQVHFTGFLEDESLLASAFREARVFVLPSEYEAFGLVLLEALVQGTPVVATKVGGVPEVIEDRRAGILVPPNDAGALEGALEELWDDESKRRQFAEYGRTQVVPRFSWDAITNQLLALYHEVLDR